jgi:hypothetical protein
VAITAEDARELLIDGAPELDERWYEVIALCSADPAARAAAA